MMVELSLIAKATLIFGVALLAARVSHRSRASVRSLILSSAFGLVLLLPVASAIAPPRLVEIPDAYTSRFLIEEEIAEPVAEQVALLTPPADPRARRWQLPALPDLMRAVWLTGALATLLPLAAGLWRLRAIRRQARVWAEGGELADALRHSVRLQRPVAVVCHDALATPMTCGWTQPMIAMPADASRWPAADVRHALLHELEHVRRHDWPVHVLARLTCSLYWFHPAAWIAWRQLALESERACDDAVVLRAENTAYAEQLVSLARRLAKGNAVPLLSMADHRTLSTRIAAILSTTAARGRVGALAAVLVLTGAAALAAAIAPVTAIGAQSRDAQAPKGPAFEVASIRRNTSSQPGQTITQRGNTFVAQNVTVRELLMTAFRVQADQMSGGPGWIDSERYDVSGRPATESSWDQHLLMVQRLLADRFNLSIRRETRQAPAYALVVSKNGPKLKTAAPCTDAPAGARCGGFATRPGSFVGRSVSLAQVATLLSGRSGRQVVNKTAIEGVYDVALTWTPDPSQLPKGPAPDDVPPFDPSGPSLFTALDEQLGLKLEATTTPAEHLVIERIDRPTPNDAPDLQVNPQARVDPQAAGSTDDGWKFDVASIKPNSPDDKVSVNQWDLRSGSLNLRNQTLLAFARKAYGSNLIPALPAERISGGPDWVRTERFTIEARAPQGSMSADAERRMLRMLRQLLEDRFQLKVRIEPRQMPVHVLVMAREGRLGPQLKSSDIDCAVANCAAGGGGGRYEFKGMQPSALARMMSELVGTAVVDETGLSGLFEGTLEWAPSPETVATRGTPATEAELARPSIFTAIQEQWGMRLVAARRPIDYLVIESAVRPPPNDAPGHQVDAPRALTFEVASVKPNVSNSTSSSSDDTPAGYTAINMPLRRLIAFAYRIQFPLDRTQIVGPSWIDAERFDIVARAPAGTVRSQIPDMLRALLIDRFKLVARPEMRETSVYALVPARNDRQTGPQLTRSALDCSQPGSGISGSFSANAPGAAVANEKPQCGLISVVDGNGAVVRGGGRSMTELARNLTGRVNRSVVDRTGLSGIYDFVLRWTPDNFQGVAADAGPSRDGTTIFTALQEQLGLKLESQRAPIEFLIIDNVERPTPN